MTTPPDTWHQQWLDRIWADLIPDPTTRAAWRTAFGEEGHNWAAPYVPYFTDPAAAARWSQIIPFHPSVAAYLHARQHPPDKQRVHAAFLSASSELDIQAGDVDQLSTQEGIRAGLLLAHPHLTRADRDAISAAGLTLTEVDHLIATGTYDRDTLTTLSGLR